MIEISQLGLNFNDETIFNDFSFRIKKGEKIVITGESGKGKSTLLNLLAGFIPEYKGQIRIFDKLLSPETVSEIRKNTAWLPQDTISAEKSVNELFFFPFTFALNKKQTPTQKEISEIFSEFHLPDEILLKQTNQISGGQRQRIMLASCLLLKKTLLLVDEPTSALDDRIKQKITDYILGQKDLTVIAASHDSYWISRSDREISL
jgi:putative ABC transport system ATP-binding protein